MLPKVTLVSYIRVHDKAFNGLTVGTAVIRKVMLVAAGCDGPDHSLRGISWLVNRSEQIARLALSHGK